MDVNEFLDLMRTRPPDCIRLVLTDLDRYLRQAVQPKPPVVWLEANACSGDSISLMNAVGPGLAQILFSIIDLRYDNALMAAQGRDAVEVLHRTARANAGEFVLIVEGAISTRAEGRFSIISWENGPISTEGRPVTALELLRWLGPQAGTIMAVGTCATHGGPSAARPNPSGSLGTYAVLNDLVPPRKVINVTGCPAHPDWTMGTLAHILMYGPPEVDAAGRPLFLYGNTVHRHCQRRSYFDRKSFASRLGDPECMFQLGCMGPVTNSDCPYRLWNTYVNWPVKASTPCIGCTTTQFPDGSTPFFAPLPVKRPEESGNRAATREGTP